MRASPSALLVLLLGSLVGHAAADGVLTNGNSQLPSCAQGCGLLIQAAQACGGTSTASQAIWSCFCQSGYLKSLYQSAAGICDSTCTNPSDNQQVSTWYNSNCGTDFGAKEHAGDAPAATTTAGGAQTTSSSAGAGATGSSDGSTYSIDENTSGSDWWAKHYQWIIMVIVLGVGLSLFGWLATWLRRRHERKQDKITGGFNAGITERTTPMSTVGSRHHNGGGASGAAAATAAGGIPGNGSGVLEPYPPGPSAGPRAGSSASVRSNSPARTREAFMPYGYGYARSNESRAASASSSRRQSYYQQQQQQQPEMAVAPGMNNRVASGSPLAREMAVTADDAERGGGSGSMSSNAAGKKRVFVRERSMEGLESPADEHDGRRGYAQ